MEKKYKNETQLFDVFEKKYKLQTCNGSWGKNWDAFNDLMTDLDWINYDKHVLVIKNYAKLFENDSICLIIQ